MAKFLFFLHISFSLTAYLFLAPYPTYADAETEFVHFAEETNWPPFTPDRFGYISEGLSFQLVEAVFSRLERGFDLELLPQKRMLEYLKTGRKDGATVMSINRDRLEYLEFSAPLFAKRGYVYYSSSRTNPIIWENYADLRGLTIGIIAGHNYGEDFENAIHEHSLRTISLSRSTQGFDLLLAGRIDCFLCINWTANELLKDPKYRGKIVHAPKSYYSKDYHMAFAKQSPAAALLPEVNKVIAEMKKDGSLAALLAEYMD